MLEWFGSAKHLAAVRKKKITRAVVKTTGNSDRKWTESVRIKQTEGPVVGPSCRAAVDRLLQQCNCHSARVIATGTPPLRETQTGVPGTLGWHQENRSGVSSRHAASLVISN